VRPEFIEIVAFFAVFVIELVERLDGEPDFLGVLSEFGPECVEEELGLVGVFSVGDILEAEKGVPLLFAYTSKASTQS